MAKLPGSTGKVAVLGYCLGALMVFLTAVRHGVDAAVAYHGGDTEKYLGRSMGFAQRSTAMRASITPSPGTMGRTTMAWRQRSPTDGQGNFHINNCGDLRLLQAVRERLYSADSGDPSLLPTRLGHSYFL